MQDSIIAKGLAYLQLLGSPALWSNLLQQIFLEFKIKIIAKAKIWAKIQRIGEIFFTHA